MKQLRQRFFVQVGADHAQAAGVVRAAVAHIDFAGHIVKLEPAAGRVLQDTLGTQHLAVFLFVGKLLQDGTDFLLLIPLRGLQADVAEHFVRVMAFAVVVMVMMVVMVVAAAGAAFAVLMMVMLMIVIIVIVVVIMIVVMMVMLMLILVIIMVMMVVMLVLILVVIMIMVMMVMLMFILVVMIVMMVMMLMLLFFIMIMFFQEFLEKFCLKVRSALDRSEDLFAVKLSDRCCNDRRLLVMGSKDLHAFRDLRVTGLVCPCKDDRTGVLDLIGEKLAEILQIELALGSIHYCDSAVQLHVRALRSTLNSLHDIG